MASISDWKIAGAEGEAVIGNCHMPEESALGVVLIAHGFKGYKDYGMFPRIARACAEAGFIAHRFNFSHSGMTNNIATFERPDLFEQDTWNKEVFDLRMVIEAIGQGQFAGQGLPYVIFGHSRGGVAALLTAGRYAEDWTFRQPMGVITAASPSRCNSFTREESEELLAKGSIESPSSRTGQKLRVGKAFLQEQLDYPHAHDLLAIASRIRCAALYIHGSADPTVDSSAAEEIRRATGERSNSLIIDGADHVFNTPNPMPEDAEPSPQLAQMLDSMTHFTKSVCEMAG